MSNLTTFRSYADADKFLGAKDYRPIGYATMVRRASLYLGNVMHVYHHNNCILSFSDRADETAFSLAGWNSPTTRDRISQLLYRLGLPVGIGTHRDTAELRVLTHAPYRHLLELDTYATYTIGHGTRDGLPGLIVREAHTNRSWFLVLPVDAH